MCCFSWPHLESIYKGLGSDMKPETLGCIQISCLTIWTINRHISAIKTSEILWDSQRDKFDQPIFGLLHVRAALTVTPSVSFHLYHCPKLCPSTHMTVNMSNLSWSPASKQTQGGTGHLGYSLQNMCRQPASPSQYWLLLSPHTDCLTAGALPTDKTTHMIITCIWAQQTHTHVMFEKECFIVLFLDILIKLNNACMCFCDTVK